MTSEASEASTPQRGVYVKLVGSNGSAGRIYVSKSLIGKLVLVTPISQDENLSNLIESIFGRKLTDLLVGKQEVSSDEPSHT